MTGRAISQRAIAMLGSSAGFPVPRMSEQLPHLLVVDDSQSTASALSALLTGAGHRVTVAKDGTEAIRLATTTDVDLVLLDVGLPGMDGFQVLRLLRAS